MLYVPHRRPPPLDNLPAPHPSSASGQVSCRRQRWQPPPRRCARPVLGHACLLPARCIFGPVAPRPRLSSRSTNKFKKPMAMMLRLDNDIIPEADEIRLFAKVRNEANRLPFWTSYYRKLGVDRFFMIDNDSTDHTVELLSRDKDVHIFSTSEKMSMARAGMDWIEPLLHQYGQNRWCLIVDADELLVYPDSESVPLREFCQMLGQINADAFGCLLIDMYPAGNIHDVTYVPGQSFVDVCPFFDSSGYKCLWADRKGPSIVGGPRLSMSPLFEHLLEISKRAIDYSRVKARLLEGLESPLGFREEDYRIEAPSNAALDDADLQIVGDAISSKSTNCLLLSNGTDILHMKSMSRKRFLLARRRLKYLL